MQELMKEEWLREERKQRMDTNVFAKCVAGVGQRIVTGAEAGSVR